MTTRVTTIQQGMALMRWVVDQVPELTMGEGRESRADLAVAGADRSILLEVGEACRGAWGLVRDRAARPDQVVITARDVERSTVYGWKNKARTFRRKKDGTFNTDGIKAALSEFVDAMRRAAESRRTREQVQQAADTQREQVKARLVALKLIKPETCSGSYAMTGGGTVRLTIENAGSVTLTTTLEVDAAEKLLRLLGVLA